MLVGKGREGVPFEVDAMELNVFSFPDFRYPISDPNQEGCRTPRNFVGMLHKEVRRNRRITPCRLGFDRPLETTELGFGECTFRGYVDVGCNRH